MGQMHVQRALELPDGPRMVVATEVSDERLQTLMERFQPLAAQKGPAIVRLQPADSRRKFV